MEQQQYLIDTNVVIDYLGQRLSPAAMQFLNGVIDEVPVISVITKIEVLGFNGAKQYMQLFSDFVYDSYVIALTADVVDKSIELRKVHKIKLPDAIIAASALVDNKILLTRNINDFKRISELSVVNPWELTS